MSGPLRLTLVLGVVIAAAAAVLLWLDPFSRPDDTPIDTPGPGVKEKVDESDGPRARRNVGGTGNEAGTGTPDEAEGAESTEPEGPPPAKEKDPFGVAIAGISGRVTDRTGSVVPYASIVLAVDVSNIGNHAVAGQELSRLTTDEAGEFFIDRLPTFERYVVRVEHVEHAAKIVGPIDLTPGRTRHIDIRLAGGLPFSGTVTDLQGNPIEGVRVACYDMMRAVEDPQDAVERSTMSLPDGSWRLEGVNPGQKELVASKSGYTTESFRSVRFDPTAAKRSWDFKMAIGTTIRGRVVTDGDEPVADAVVTATEVRIGGAYTPFPRFIVPARSDRNGEFVVDGLPKALFMVTARADGYIGAGRANARGGDDDVELRLAPATLIKGRVISEETGDPVTAFSLVASPTDKLMARVRQHTQRVFDDNGEFAYTLKLANPAYTHIWLFAVAPGYAGGVAKIQLTVEPDRPGPQRDLVENVLIKVSSGGTIAGTVTDLAGKGIPGAKIYVIPKASRDANRNPFNALFSRTSRGVAVDAISDEEGRYSVPNRLPGLYSIRVEHSDHAHEQSDHIVQVQASETVDYPPIVLGGGGRVYGTVRDKKHRPQEGAHVVLAPKDLLGERYSMTTGLSGAYDFKHVRPGTYWLEVASRHGLPSPSLFDPQAALHSKLEVKVEEGGEVRQDL